MKTLTILEAIHIFPRAYSEGKLPILPEYNFEDGHSTATFIETEGDLQDCLEAIKEAQETGSMDPITYQTNFLNFAMASCCIMNYWDFDKLEPAINFKNRYPALYRTIQVYAWG